MYMYNKVYSSRHILQFSLGSDNLIFKGEGVAAGRFRAWIFLFTRDADLHYIYNTIRTIEFTLSSEAVLHIFGQSSVLVFSPVPHPQIKLKCSLLKNVKQLKDLSI